MITRQSYSLLSFPLDLSTFFTCHFTTVYEAILIVRKYYVMLIYVLAKSQDRNLKVNNYLPLILVAQA